jgi:hypothetical protein
MIRRKGLAICKTFFWLYILYEPIPLPEFFFQKVVKKNIISSLSHQVPNSASNWCRQYEYHYDKVKAYKFLYQNYLAQEKILIV